MRNYGARSVTIQIQDVHGEELTEQLLKVEAILFFCFFSFFLFSPLPLSFLFSPLPLSKRIDSEAIVLKQCVMPTLAPEILLMENLRSLSIEGCGWCFSSPLSSSPAVLNDFPLSLGLERLPNAILKLKRLKCLYLKSCPLQAVPDLSQLENLTHLSLPSSFQASLGVSSIYTSYWASTRALTVMCKKKFYFGGARSAIYTLLLIKKFTTILDLISKDVMNIILGMLYRSRGDAVWKTADKHAYDIETYHCDWPPPFATCFGPRYFFS
jgi:hypothetical protein